MLFADELVSPDSIEELPDEDVTATDREVQMARQLIESLATEFDPAKYTDEYRERVLDLIERKAEGQEVASQPPVEEPTSVPDLMSALEASLVQAKKDRAPAEDGGAPRKKRAASADGAKPTKKKQPAAKRSTKASSQPAKRRPKAKT